MERVNLLRAVNDELLNRKTALADRFTSVYCSSIGYHLWNKVNQEKAIYFEQGRLKNTRLHVIMVAPPGFMKSYLMEQFLDGPYSILHQTGIDTAFIDIVTEAGLIGTVTRGPEGQSIIEPGLAHKHMHGIIGCDEFSGITTMMKQGHSATLDTALLKLLDSGKISKQLAAGPLEYSTQFTFWASTQPMRFELYGGLFRRFLPIEFIPNEAEKEVIRIARREGRNTRPKEYQLKNLRTSVQDLIHNQLTKIVGIKFDPAIDKFFNSHKGTVPHFEEAVYERFCIGYTVMKNEFTDILNVELDKDLQQTLEQLIKWRLNLKRGSASSQAIKIMVEHKKEMHESVLKQELLDFGMTWSDSSILITEMVRDRIVKRAASGELQLLL